MNMHPQKLVEECYKSEIELSFPDSLELLDEFRRIKIFNKSFLEDVTILFIQHHLYPLIGRLLSMKKDGMKPEKTWFIDIPYSTNEDVKIKIRNEFTNHDYPPALADPLENYDNFQTGRIKEVFKTIINSNPTKLLVVDDGGYFIRALHYLCIQEPDLVEKLKSRIYLVEQTTKGHRTLRDLKYSSLIEILNIPMVSIARSKTKLEIESPFIGIACKRAIENNSRIVSKISSLNRNEIKVAIIGYGPIGKAVFDSAKALLGTSANIYVVEIDINKWQEIKENQGIPVAELSDTRYDILFGCTGYSAFNWSDRDKVNPDGLLISVSSAAVEFSRFNFIEVANLYPDDSIKIEIVDPEKGIHSDLLFQDSSNRFYFINSGFPVNFTGAEECIPLKFIQPTHALLYAASYQVLNEPKYGLQPLKEEYDNWIYYNSFVSDSS